MLKYTLICILTLITSLKIYAQPNGYDQALALLTDGDATRCLKICDSILTYDTKNHEVQLLKAEALIELSMLGDATELLTSVIHEQSRPARAHALLGYIYVIKGVYRTARNEYIQAIAYDSSQAAYYYNLANVEQMMEKWNDAISHYTKAIVLKKNYVDAYKNRGYIYLNLFRHLLALRDFDSALKYSQNNTDIMLYRGMTLTSLKRYKEALLMFDRCIRLKPSSGDAYFNKGLVFYQLKDYKRSISILDSALLFNEDLSIAYYQRGLAKLEWDKHERSSACTDFSKAIQKGNMEALFYLKRYCE
jgi:tetratricopeptide (TPR) repeat protein